MALASSCWFNCGDVLRVTVKNFKQRFNRSGIRAVFRDRTARDRTVYVHRDLHLKHQ